MTRFAGGDYRVPFRFGGVLKPTIILAVVVLAMSGTSAVVDAANGWNHKALPNERQASAIVGGFSKSGARYYHDGLVYIRSNGFKVGSKTISDVVELGKRHREDSHRAGSVPANNVSEPASDALPSLLTFIFLLGLFIFFMTRKRRPSSNVVTTPTGPSEYELARTCAIVPISVPGMMLHKGEVFYLRTDGDVDVIAEHHHAEYIGGYAGVSMRVMRGLSVRTGSSRGTRLDRTTLDVDDHGTLYVSNQRVLFVGGRKTVDIPFTRLVGVEAFVDGMKVNRSNAKPLVLQTGSQREAVILQRIMANDLQPPRPVQPTAPPPHPVSTNPPPAYGEPGPTGEGAPQAT